MKNDTPIYDALWLDYFSRDLEVVELRKRSLWERLVERLQP